MLTTRDGYDIDTARPRLDLTRIHRWLTTDAYWALGRTAAVTERAVDGSLCFGVYAPGGAQVGFARAVTDRATFAWLCDVYIDPAHRGRGLGTWLAEVATRHLIEEGVRRVVLATRDAHGIYEKVGFTPLVTPHSWMEVRPAP